MSKGTVPKVILFQKTPPSLRATSFFPYLRGSTPNGGGSLKNDFLDSPLFLLKKNKGAYLPMITQEKPMMESFPLGKHFPPKNYFRIIRKGQFSITVRIRNACS